MILLLFALLYYCPTYQPANKTLLLKVENVKSDKGQILIAVFNNNKDFLKIPAKSYARPMNTKESDWLILKLDDLPYGRYAISLFHDENENNELDTNTFGIPKEPFGFSNNQMGIMGPPSFSDSAFEFSPQSDTLKIKLKSIL